MTHVDIKEVSNGQMFNGNEKIFTHVIQNGILTMWAGLVWIYKGKATLEDYHKYPIVIHNLDTQIAQAKAEASQFENEIDNFVESSYFVRLSSSEENANRFQKLVNNCAIAYCVRQYLAHLMGDVKDAGE